MKQETMSKLIEEASSDHSIQEVLTLGAVLKDLEDQIEKAEDALSVLKEKKREIAEVHLPDIMEGLNVTSFTLNDGSRINLTRFYNAKIKDWEQALSYLEATNNIGLVSSGFELRFHKGESEKAKKAAELLREVMNIPVKIDDKIHPSSLKAFVREKCEANDPDFPKEIFGVFEGRRVVFK